MLLLAGLHRFEIPREEDSLSAASLAATGGACDLGSIEMSTKIEYMVGCKTDILNFMHFNR